MEEKKKGGKKVGMRAEKTGGKGGKDAEGRKEEVEEECFGRRVSEERVEDRWENGELNLTGSDDMWI